MAQNKEELERLLGKDYLRGMRKETLENLLLKYKLVRTLGAGGNASVFEAERIKDSRPVAVKVLRSGTDEKKIRFKREADILKEYGPKVAGIMPIGACASDEHEHWYEMPVTEPVADRLSKLPLSERLTQSVEVILSCAKTLAALHRYDVSHRDVKPDNIHFNGNMVVMGDFGLVDVPELDNLTRSDVSLGPIFTMAPEMRRNPKTADGKKADVYSLAKTLWMLVRNDKYAFDGPYDWLDEKIGLGGLSTSSCKLHLAELEELIKDSTDNDPERRPPMEAVVKRLEAWREAEANPLKAQVAEWNFLKRIIFSKCVPNVSIFRQTDEIAVILQAVSHTSAANHTLFSFRGGLDLIGVESAAESGFLALRFDHDTIMIKPGLLQIGVFEDSELNYLLLEAAEASPISGLGVSQGMQNLVEDKPGHYVAPLDAVYGVYDYDTGVPLPNGWRYVTRMTKGRLLIVSKTGPYNAISEVYDGRHGDGSLAEFHAYVERIEHVLYALASKNIDWRKADLSKLSILAKNPFVREQESVPVFSARKASVSPAFFYEKIVTCDFSVVLDSLSLKPQRSGCFSISLEPRLCFGTDEDQQQNYVLSLDGHLHPADDPNVELACFLSLNDVRGLVLRLDQVLEECCHPYGGEFLDFDYGFDVHIESLPCRQMNFSANDILSFANNADDREWNRFVVDDDGRLYLLTGEQARDARFYPVRNEPFEPRKNNVGKYSCWDLEKAQRYEATLKNAWERYCATRHFIYLDDLI